MKLREALEVSPTVVIRSVGDDWAEMMLIKQLKPIHEPLFATNPLRAIEIWIISSIRQVVDRKPLSHWRPSQGQVD